VSLLACYFKVFTFATSCYIVGLHKSYLVLHGTRMKGTMSYRRIGGIARTLRGLFENMEPLSHDRTMESSQVLAHIAQVLGCDLLEARRAFDSMRQCNSRVLVFDRNQGQWHGAAWMPSSETDQSRMIARRLADSGKAALKADTVARKTSKDLEKLEDALYEELDGLRNDLDAVRKQLDGLVKLEAALAEMQKTLSALADKVKSIDDDLTTVYGRVGESEAQIQHLSKGVSVPLLDLYAAVEVPVSAQSQ